MTKGQLKDNGERCTEHTGISILVLAQPKVVITHFDLWNQTPNQDMEWTP